MVTLHVRKTVNPWCVALLIGLLSPPAAAQFCPAGTILYPWYITQTLQPQHLLFANTVPGSHAVEWRL